MKKQTLFILLFLFITISGCHTIGKKIEGVFTYTKDNTKEQSFFSMGRELGCSMIGDLEFTKNGWLISQNGTFGHNEVRYSIRGNMVHTGADTFSSGQPALYIKDENTLEFNGCTFKRIKYEDTFVAWIKRTTKIRTAPSFDDRAIETYRRGEEVLVLNADEEIDSLDWLSIRNGPIVGFVKRDCISFDEIK